MSGTNARTMSLSGQTEIAAKRAEADRRAMDKKGVDGPAGSERAEARTTNHSTSLREMTTSATDSCIAALKKVNGGQTINEGTSS